MLDLARQLQWRFAATRRKRTAPHPLRTAFSNAFTPRAREALSAAQEEAQRLGHNFLGTEHILLGLLSQDGGLAASVLRELGIDHSRARQAVEDIIGRGSHADGGALCLTARSNRVLKLAVDEAQRSGQRSVGTG